MGPAELTPDACQPEGTSMDLEDREGPEPSCLSQSQGQPDVPALQAGTSPTYSYKLRSPSGIKDALNVIYYTVVVNSGRLETSVLSGHKREEQEVRRSRAEVERPQAMFTEVEKTGLE